MTVTRISSWNELPNNDRDWVIVSCFGNTIEKDHEYLEEMSDILYDRFLCRHLVVYGGPSRLWRSVALSFEGQADWLRQWVKYTGVNCVSGTDFWEHVSDQDVDDLGHILGISKRKA